MRVVTGHHPTQKQLHVDLSNSGFPNTSLLAIFSPPTDLLSFPILMLAAPFSANINTADLPRIKWCTVYRYSHGGGRRGLNLDRVTSSYLDMKEFHNQQNPN